jgi:hypothetical protein
VGVMSDDETQSWTWDARGLFSTDTHLLGVLGDTSRDFKSPAWHDVKVRDLLFTQVSSDYAALNITDATVWASYHGVFGGKKSLGEEMAGVESLGCPAAGPHSLSAGNLGDYAVGGASNDTTGFRLCDASLRFSWGGGGSACPNASHGSPGPVWAVGTCASDPTAPARGGLGPDYSLFADSPPPPGFANGLGWSNVEVGRAWWAAIVDIDLLGSGASGWRRDASTYMQVWVR